MSLRASDARRYGGKRPPTVSRREPAFWLYVTLIAIGAWATVLQQHVLERMSPSGFALSWLLLLLYLIPAVGLISHLDITRTQPASLLAAAFLWGAVTATALARLGEVGWGLVVARLGGPDFAARWTAALTAAPIEETAKALGVVLLAMIASKEFHDRVDGFVYGALVGLGFAVVEDVVYFVAVFGGTPGDVLKGFLVRVMANGIYGHVLWTGLSGLGVAYWVSMRHTRTAAKRVAVAGTLLVVAMTGHFLWDSPILEVPSSSSLMAAFGLALKGLPFLAFAAIIIVLARRRERTAIGIALQEEASHGTIRSDELATLATASSRRRARRQIRHDAGGDAASTLRRLQRSQLRLAALVDRYGANYAATNKQRTLCTRLRKQLDVTPQRRDSSDAPRDVDT